MLTLLAACHHEPEPTDSADAPLEGTFAEVAARSGFTVTAGRLGTLGEVDCCAPGAVCLFDDPAMPVVAYLLPPAPGQTAPDVGVTADGLASNWHLRPDEAVVLLGRTPPQAKWFGAASFVTYRFDDGVVSVPRGALGPALNNAAIGLAQGSAADVPYAVVTTFDAALEAKLVDWLVRTGWDPATVYTDRLPPELVRPGLTDTADTFANLTRVAGFSDPAAGAAWVADPGAEVLRLTPETAEAHAVEPHPVAELPVGGSGLSENGFRVAFGKLGEAITAAFPDRLHLETESFPLSVEPYTCIDAGGCGFDISDRYYARSLPFDLVTDDEFVVAFGVNHERSEKAAYASLAIEDVVRTLTVATLEAPALDGSARAWLPDDPLVDDLYAVVFARDCAAFGEALCVEVPTECPGAEREAGLYLTFRAYLDPLTGTAPTAAELVVDRAIKFFPPLPTGTTSTTTTGTTTTGTGTTTTGTGTTSTGTTGSGTDTGASGTP
ncbi:MAG: hypothetical protein ABMB14_24945 [Myxococcota bacterium]